MGKAVAVDRPKLSTVREKDFLTVQELAILVNVSERTIWRKEPRRMTDLRNPADASVWTNDDGRLWRGVHTGACPTPLSHHQGDDLPKVLTALETCAAHAYRWTLRVDTDGQPALVGWHDPDPIRP